MKMATKNDVAAKTSSKSRSKPTENFNPNVLNTQNPNPKPLPNSPSSSSSSPSPVVKKCSFSPHKSQKPSLSKNPNNPAANSPHNKIRQRKFVVVAKKKNPTALFCKCKEEKGESKCFCVAYENLRKSQEDFFSNKNETEEKEEEEEEEEKEKEKEEELENSDCDFNGKRMRDKDSAPSNGCGKVMNLVKAFEKLMCSKDEEQEEEEKKVMKLKVPVLQFSAAIEGTEVSGSSSFCPPQLTLTSENLGLEPKADVGFSWDSSRGSLSSRTSNGDRRSRRNSLESSSTLGRRRSKTKQPRVTSQKPFKLRTERRGKLKEEEFEKKVQEMMTEEEKQRIPLAQGLPLTTDEPECLIKPPVKESTRPIDLKLHSDVRAMDRAEFDHQVAEKLVFIEQYKLERERQKMLAEEEELKRLRKELIPKAQPMPYFDRPFIPRRSVKNPTIPRESKFHSHHHKKIKCSIISSWNDVNPCSSSYLDS